VTTTAPGLRDGYDKILLAMWDNFLRKVLYLTCISSTTRSHFHDSGCRHQPNEYVGLGFHEISDIRVWAHLVLIRLLVSMTNPRYVLHFHCGCPGSNRKINGHELRLASRTVNQDWLWAFRAWWFEAKCTNRCWEYLYLPPGASEDGDWGQLGILMCLGKLVHDKQPMRE
jgi:hypothetical protein